MKYVVKRYWELCDSVEVNADSPSQAIELAHEMPIDNARAAFVPEMIHIPRLATGGAMHVHSASFLTVHPQLIRRYPVRVPRIGDG